MSHTVVHATVHTAIRVAIADDHAIFRQGLQLLLQSQTGYQVVAEIASLDQVLPTLQTQAVDLLILDYHMPGGESSAVLAYCKQRYPELKIIALTGANSGVIFKQLRDAKADAVLQKKLYSMPNVTVIVSALTTEVHGDGSKIGKSVV